MPELYPYALARRREVTDETRRPGLVLPKAFRQPRISGLQRTTRSFRTLERGGPRYGVASPLALRQLRYDFGFARVTLVEADADRPNSVEVPGSHAIAHLSELGPATMLKFRPREDSRKPVRKCPVQWMQAVRLQHPTPKTRKRWL